MSRLLCWDGSEMDFVTETFIKSMRLLFSTWTKHTAVVVGGTLICKGSKHAPKVSKWLLLGSIASYGWRVFASHAGGHRYFAHMSFKTSKLFEMMLALTVQVSASNENIVYWINFHEFHHQACETEEDIHTPWRMGFWAVQLQDSSANLVTTQEGLERLFRTDLLQFRYLNDLVWLRNRQLEIKACEHLLWLLCGKDVFFWVCLLPNVLHFHAIRLTNSAAHLWGYRPYVAQFQSECRATNNWWVALFNGGEGWHNNHHAFMGSAKHGFMWWELDWVYLGLLVLGKLGVVWDIKVPTQEVLEARYKGGSKRDLGIKRLYRLECESADSKRRPASPPVAWRL
uniref:Fatty acid desaturase domain-containing protein n=1 Tax=Hanusia phi TaxID=3032 RepID=A0A7S0EJV7_9CRYP|mmetsp:Transcript_25094/g.56637  ORF Transcript_25094/g.56637 Transcript_25094/m.56637 type:complete len:341 (+) Transcript_25094:21-1043(+)